jgi:hypothetical protein
VVDRWEHGESSMNCWYKANRVLLSKKEGINKKEEGNRAYRKGRLIKKNKKNSMRSSLPSCMGQAHLKRSGRGKIGPYLGLLRENLPGAAVCIANKSQDRRSVSFATLLCMHASRVRSLATPGDDACPMIGQAAVCCCVPACSIETRLESQPASQAAT